MDDLLDLSWSDNAASGGGQRSRTGSASGSLPVSAAPSRTGSAFDLLSKPAGGPNYSRTSTPIAPTPSYPNGAGASSGLGGMGGLGTFGSVGASPKPAGTPSGSSGLNGLNGLGGGMGAMRPTSTASRSGAASPAVTPAATTTPPPASDAFSSLLGVTSSTLGGKNLTMAERQAQLAAKKQADAEHQKAQWDWDSFGGSGAAPAAAAAAPIKATPAAPTPSSASALPNIGLKPTPPTSRPASAARAPVATTTGKSSAGSFWDNDDFLSSSSSRPKSQSPSPPIATPPVAKSSSPAPAAVADPWDFDSLPVATPSSRNTAQTEIEYPADGGDEDDDLLGELGRPVRTREPPKQTPARNDTSTSSRRALSPPPHVVGQIVEMGFSPAQARTALAATPTGLDVQAALDSLLQAQGAAAGDDEDLEIDDEAIARAMQAREDREAHERVARHAARRAGPSRDSVRARPERERPQQQGHDGEDDDDIGKQVDQVMAQASEIGASVLSKATSFWNSGKEKALKVYEEQKRAYEQQQAQTAGKRRQPVTDGRPRWMVEAEEAEAGEQRATGDGPRRGNGAGPTQNGGGFADSAAGGFRDDFDDDHHDDVLPPRPTKPTAKPAVPQPTRDQPKSNLSVKERADLLFAEEPKRYVSKNRHMTGRGTPAATPAPAQATPRRPTTPLVQRQLVPATPAQTATAAQHKLKGNEHFKLGRFAEADAAYTLAIGALPSGHIHLVTLHNNRAATRLKLGEGAGAAADCTAALDIIGPGYHPSKEAPLPASVADVKLADALVKATTKRAQAWEMAEKWNQALEDWQKVLGFDAGMLGAAAGAGGVKTLASDGTRRAKAMLSPSPSAGPSSAGATPSARPKPISKPATPKPSRPVDVGRSAAVGELRKAAAQAAGEDEERMQLKDSVDARLNAWRGGKETNLRALVASLDTVLWDGILAGGLKVGMHELITEKQVKIKYMKVIARLHPDKLKTSDTTVEQRMLANGAFGTLNEAWAAFNGSS